VARNQAVIAFPASIRLARRAYRLFRTSSNGNCAGTGRYQALDNAAVPPLPIEAKH
jgi:hypothetical protein